MIQRGVAIERMALSGAVQHRDALLQSFDVQRWPVEDDEKVVIIRRIAVRAPWWQAAAEASSIAFQSAANALHISHPGVKEAEAVYFKNRAEYIVYLFKALLSDAYHHWYWQTHFTTALPTQIVLTNLLCDSVVDVPAIFICLNREGLIPDLFKMLGLENLQKIYANLCQITQWNTCKHALVPRRIDSKDYSLPKLNQAVFEWYPAISGFKEREVILPLIALISAWRYSPYRLRDSIFSTAWQSALEIAINDGTLTELDPIIPTKIHLSENEFKGAVQSIAGQNTERNEVYKENASSANQKAVSVDNVEAQVLQLQELESQIFVTRFGGIFFLINALQIAKCVNAISESGIPPWLIIESLARSFGCGVDEGLAEFLTVQEMDLRGNYQVDMGQVVKQIVAKLESHFRSRICWGTEFFIRRARIEQRFPNINVYFHTSSVQLDMRMLGLDVDPGWQPWLGMVVKYHYVKDPDLLPLNQPQDRAYE